VTSSEVRPDGRVEGQRRRDDFVVRTITQHADALLRTARRHSLCDDDAADAYQRAVELFLRHAHRVDPSRADRWLHVVTRREALAVRDLRKRSVASGEPDLDAFESRHTRAPDERAVSFDEVARTAEALQRLKPAEAQALWLRAEGRTYDQIADELGWTRTKVNRCIAEGRARLRARLAGIESGAECARWAPVLSAMHDGEASAADLAAARPHLRNCAGCRSSVRAMHEDARSLGILLPAGPVAEDRVADLVTRVEHAGTGAGARLHELLIGAAQERVVGGVVKVQALADLVSASKVAAVAASAAAVAGGGVAVEHVARSDAPRPAATRPAASAAVPAPASVPVAAAPATSRPVGAAGTPAGTARTTSGSTSTTRERERQRERERERARRRAEEERRASDFAPGVVERPASSQSAQTASAPGAPAAAPAPAPAPAGPGTVVTADPPASTAGPGSTVSGSGGSGGILP
jgi:RNA polymerase sigma factor (sigma-70 family)